MWRYSIKVISYSPRNRKKTGVTVTRREGNELPNGLVDPRFAMACQDTLLPTDFIPRWIENRDVYICRIRYPLVRQKSLRAFRSSPRLTTIEYIWIISKWTFAIPCRVSKNKLFSKQHLSKKKYRVHKSSLFNQITITLTSRFDRKIILSNIIIA